MYEHIPQELKNLQQWVCWKKVPDKVKPDRINKIPINAKNGEYAESDNDNTWTDFDTAVKASSQFSGIGFMFASGYFGVDLDGAENAIEDYQHGDTDNIIAEFIHTLQSYAEYSQSGKGIHIICKGQLPPFGRKKGHVEMYQEKRFFATTGNIAAEYKDIRDCTETIKPLHEKHIGAGREPSLPVAPAQPLTLTENDVIEAAQKSKQSVIFSDLLNGNWESYFPSQSEADMSFCNMLAFWCRKDENLMDGIFRKSGLMRDKWDRKQAGSTYGKITLISAISSCQNVYEPQQEYKIFIGPQQEKPIKYYSFDDTGNAQRFIDSF